MKVFDHFYTTVLDSSYPEKAGYRNEGIACVVLSQPLPEVSTVPVYRYFKPSVDDGFYGNHFYTISKAEGDIATTHNGYRVENKGEPVWHIFENQCTSPCCGTVPFYRWQHSQRGDYLYTTHPTGELGPSVGLVYQGILGYVFRPDAPIVGSRKPLYRWYKG